jgi:hypothetical protein
MNFGLSGDRSLKSRARRGEYMGYWSYVSDACCRSDCRHAHFDRDA